MLPLRNFMIMLAALATLMLSVTDTMAQVGGGFGGGFGGRSHGNRNGNADQSGSDGKVNSEKRADIPDSNNYEQINFRLSQIQEDLKLESSQLGAWLTFASKVRAYAADITREKSYASASLYQAVGLQHIGQTLDSARNRLTALEDVESSVKPLYLVLKPEQKNLLDMRIPTVVAPRPISSGAVNQNAASFDRK